METLHLKADSQTIEQIMSVVNQASKDGHDIEVLDNTTFDMEKEMILKGLIAEQQGKVIDHDTLWKKLHKNQRVASRFILKTQALNKRVASWFISH